MTLGLLPLTIHAYFFYQVLPVFVYIPQNDPIVERKLGARHEALRRHYSCLLGIRDAKPYRNVRREYEAL